MAKLNWNRPNGGYELEPWRKNNTTLSTPKTPKKHYDTMPNGQYKGVPIQQLPQHYLEQQILCGKWNIHIMRCLDREWLRRQKLQTQKQA